jgi:hypothetical protein
MASEEYMSPAAGLSLPSIPPDVRAFADEKGVGSYLPEVIELAGRAFPSCALTVSLGQDAEEETHRYIAVDVDAGAMGAEGLLAGQRAWSAGLPRVCPSRHAVYFVMGWR